MSIFITVKCYFVIVSFALMFYNFTNK